MDQREKAVRRMWTLEREKADLENAIDEIYALYQRDHQSDKKVLEMIERHYRRLIKVVSEMDRLSAIIKTL